MSDLFPVVIAGAFGLLTYGVTRLIGRYIEKHRPPYTHCPCCGRVTGGGYLRVVERSK